MSGEYKAATVRDVNRSAEMCRKQVENQRQYFESSLREERRERNHQLDQIRQRQIQTEKRMMSHINNLSADVQRKHIQQLQALQNQSNNFYREQQRMSERFDQQLDTVTQTIDRKFEQANAVQEALANMVEMNMKVTSDSLKSMHHYLYEVNRQNELNNKILENNIQLMELGNKKQIQELAQKIDNLHGEEQKKIKMAELKRGDFEVERMILFELPWRKYAQKETEEALQEVDGIDGLPAETQITFLHRATQKLLALQMKVMEAKLEFENMYIITLQSVKTLLKTMYKNRTQTKAMDPEGEVYILDDGSEAMIELDFWTENKYSQLEKEAKRLQQLVEESIDSPEQKVDFLNEVQKRVHEIHNQQSALIKEAIEKANASEVRAEVGDIIREVLENNNYELTDSAGYECGDQRKSYGFKMRNIDDGNEMSVLIYPEDVYSNRLILKPNNTTHYVDERTCSLQSREINKALRENGLQVPDIGQGCNDENSHTLDELYDMRAFHRSGLSRQALKELSQ